ncbi:calcium-binding protein [Cyanobacterium aponinum AL20118]|uniref:Calcium-binding protein n=1 Tax=Cyanobacterium aponinum AL20115 TaxID=3090662 RepID=A0AAF1C4Q2_9CHRO|nr:calcium-binding protein [Cyanobacterium aponinum]WPF87370.1 calcium-binding protein [Cyanobacterium aponinum AL20115]
MSSIPEDSQREERIDFEIVVDAYDEEERRMGWYYYLQDNLNFPFSAKWLNRKERDVIVVDLSSEDDCLDDISVVVEYDNDQFSAKLDDIEPIGVDETTQTVVDDWKYWVARGYEF